MMNVKRIQFGVALLWTFVSFSLAFAQSDGSANEVGIPWTGNPGMTETIDEIMLRQSTVPELPPGTVKFAGDEIELKHILPPPRLNPESPDVSSWPPRQIGSNQQSGQANPTAKDKERIIYYTTPRGAGGNGMKMDATKVESVPKSVQSPQTIGTSFMGPRLSESGYIPPDTQGDVGPTQIVIIVNGRIKVYDKAGSLGALNATMDVFFASVQQGGSFDPRVRYDRLSGRWFITAADFNTPNRILIAVSSGPVITGAASFTFFAFQHDLVGPTPNANTGGFADYPTLGVDANALYIGINVFSPFTGSTGFVVNKANLLANTLTVTAFRQIADASGAGCLTPYGVANDDPVSAEGYFIGVDWTVFGRLVIRRVSTPGGTPSISGNLNITVPTTSFPINQVALGSTFPLDAIDTRLYAAMIKENKNTGLKTLWTAHTNEVNASGVSVSGGGRNGCRWYELENLTTTPSLRQSGTLFDPAGSNPIGYWFPGAAMSGQGHMALGSSYANSLNYAGAIAAGRYATDVLGSIQPATVTQTGIGAYNV